MKYCTSTVLYGGLLYYVCAFTALSFAAITPKDFLLNEFFLVLRIFVILENVVQPIAIWYYTEAGNRSWFRSVRASLRTENWSSTVLYRSEEVSFRILQGFVLAKSSLTLLVTIDAGWRERISCCLRSSFAVQRAVTRSCLQRTSSYYATSWRPNLLMQRGFEQSWCQSTMTHTNDHQDWDHDQATSACCWIM